jgi:hypothetical protein
MLTVDPGRLKRFGLVMAAALAVAGIVVAYRGGPRPAVPGAVLLGLAGFFLGAAFAFPALLSPLEWAWMKLASALGWVTTRLFLTLFFYLVLTPVALVLRLLGKDPIDRRIARDAKTYWRTRKDQRPPDHLERLF